MEYYLGLVPCHAVFSLFIVFLISVLIGLLVLMGSGRAAGEISAGSVGGGLLRSFSKCFTHLFDWSSCLVMSSVILICDCNIIRSPFA